VFSAHVICVLFVFSIHFSFHFLLMTMGLDLTGPRSSKSISGNKNTLSCPGRPTHTTFHRLKTFGQT